MLYLGLPIKNGGSFHGKLLVITRWLLGADHLNPGDPWPRNSIRKMVAASAVMDISEPWQCEKKHMCLFT